MHRAKGRSARGKNKARSTAFLRPFLEVLESRLLLSITYPDMQTIVHPLNNPTLPSGMDVFTPPVTEGAPAASTPTLAGWTQTGGPDNVLTLTGDLLTSNGFNNTGRDTEFTLYGQTTASNSVLADATIESFDGQTAAAAVPSTMPAGGMYLLWPGNAQGYGYPEAINKTDAWWIGPESATDGSTVSIYGQNLSYHDGTSQSWVYVEPVAPTVDFGNPLVHGTNTDIYNSGIYYHLAQPLPSGQTVASWGFFNDSGSGQEMTPVIFHQTAPGQLTIVGVGTTRVNNGGGEQDYSFTLTSGTNVIPSSGTYFFGWRNGGITASDRTYGAPQYNSWVPNSMNAYGCPGPPARRRWRETPSAVMDGYSQMLCTYSVHCVTSSAPAAAAPFWATVTSVNPYQVNFTVPSNLPDGNYNVWIHNGSGGEYGWSGPLTLTVVDPIELVRRVYNVKNWNANRPWSQGRRRDGRHGRDQCVHGRRPEPRGGVLPRGNLHDLHRLQLNGGGMSPQMWYGAGERLSIIKLTANATGGYVLWDWPSCNTPWSTT